MWNLFKVNNKDSAFIVNFAQISNYSGVSIVNFEQLNIWWFWKRQSGSVQKMHLFYASDILYDFNLCSTYIMT